MIKRFLILFGFAAFILLPSLYGQSAQQQISERTRILFLFDASGSMLAPWENTYRIAAAKKLLSDLVDSLRVNPNLELALRVYGHQFHRKYQNCKDTRLEVPFAKNNHDDIKRKLLNITPQGTTPIAYSLQQAANDFDPNTNTRNIIIIITDGIESCDGDPCAVSLALQRRNIFLKPFIIGIGMDKNFEEQFKCVGEFVDAKNINSFRRALSSAITQSLQKATVSVKLLDINNQPTETNVNVTFMNSFTGDAQYEFVHYLDRYGRPDSVEVDPVLNYDLVVNTVPRVVLRDVHIEGGRHNVIRVKSPQGNLQLNMSGHTEYAGGVHALIRKAGKRTIEKVLTLPAKQKLLVGNYDIEVLTLPRTYLRNVSINQSQTADLNIESPGVINIVSSFPGYGSIYQLFPQGGQLWVANIDENTTRSILALQPGRYKFVFRSKNSLGSKYTQFKQTDIRPGSTVNIRF
jgi:Ca-activated chloride channel homolog